jgi:hypothetical protein
MVTLLPEDTVARGDGNPSFSLTIYGVTSPPDEGTAVVGAKRVCDITPVADSSAGIFVLAEDTLTVCEGDSHAVLTVRRTDGTQGIVSCEVNTKDGVAVAPNDYTAVGTPHVTPPPDVSAAPQGPNRMSLLPPLKDPNARL